MVRREKSNYIIRSVSHALDVIEQFFGEADELGVTELSKRLKLHKNNIFRLLATLESRGYIEQNKATENYRLGLRSLHLGQAYVSRMGLLRQARPIMEALVKQVRESAYVAVARPGGGDREAAVAGHDGGDAVVARRRERRVPEHLGVVVGVDVDEAGAHDAAGGVELLVAGEALADGDDASCGHRDVGCVTGRSRAVDHRAAANHQHLCLSHVAPSELESDHGRAPDRSAPIQSG